MALFNKDAKTKSLQDRLAERIQNSVQSSQAPYAPVTDKKDAAVANVTNTLKKTSTDPAAFTAALQGKVNPAKKGIDTKSVDSQTTQQAVTQEAGAQPTNRADNSYLDSYYSKRDETAGRTGTTVTPGSVKIDQSVFNDKSADSTVKNTLLSYYSKRQFENGDVASRRATPTQTQSKPLGQTIDDAAAALGSKVKTFANDYILNNNYQSKSGNTNPSLSEYAYNRMKTDPQGYRQEVGDGVYKAVQRELSGDKSDSRAYNVLSGTAKHALGETKNIFASVENTAYNSANDNATPVGMTEYGWNQLQNNNNYLRNELGDDVYNAVMRVAAEQNVKTRRDIANANRATADAMIESGSAQIEKAKEGLGTLGQLGIDAASSGLEVLGDALVASVTGGASLVPMFLRAAGGGEYQARQAGATDEQALAFGSATGMLEAATEKMFEFGGLIRTAYGPAWAGSVDTWGKNLVEQASRKLAKSEFGHQLAYKLGMRALGAAGEAAEEVVSGLVSPFIEKAIYNPDAKIDPKEVAHSALVGGIIGGLMGGGQVMSNRGYNNPVMVNSLVDIAKANNDPKSSIYKFADTIGKASAENKSVTNQEVSDLLEMLSESSGDGATNKLYDLAGVKRSEKFADVKLNAAIADAFASVSEAISDPQMTEKSRAKLQKDVEILSNALVSDEVSDYIKPYFADAIKKADANTDIRLGGAVENTVGIRRGDTVSYHVSQGVNETAPAVIEGYDVVRKHDNGTVDYIWTDDFNGNAFPEITRQVTVDARGKQTDTTPKTATIINDKSTLVPQNYTGFNVEEQRANENYWKEGRKRTGLSYNTTQMNNKAYFNRYWDSLMSYENRAQNAQEVNNNVGTESSSETPERNNEVSAAEQGVRGGGDSYIDRAITELNFRRNYRRSRGLDESRLDQVESVLSGLRENGAKEVTAKKFAGKIGGSENATVIPVTGKAAKQFASLTKELKKAGFKTIKYYAGPLTLEQNGNQITVNGVFDGDTVFVQVDDYQFTPEQIAKHETLHRMIRSNPNLFKAIEDRVVARYGQEQLNRMVADYTEGYNDPSMSQRDIEEEIFCDAYGSMDVLSSDGSSYFGASIFNEAVNEAAEITTESVETAEQDEVGTPQSVESTEVEAPAEHTEEPQEITTEDVNAEVPTAETTEESVNTEPIRIKRSRDAEWEDVSKEDAIAYGRELYGNLGNVKDPSRRLQMVNNSIQGYALTAEDVGGIESVDRDVKGAKVDAQTNAAIEKAAASDANQEIWDEPNAKLIFSGKAKSPDAYKFEVVEEKPNGTVTHTFFDTEDKATAHAEGRNQKNKTGAAIVVNLDESGALDRAVDESSKANMEAFEEDERRASKYSRTFVRQFDDWLENGVTPKRNRFYIGKTPTALQSIGVDVNDIYWSAKKVSTVMREHPEMTAVIVRQVPNIIENPIIVMQSQTVVNSITMFGEVSDIDGNPVLVAINLTPSNKKNNEQDFYIVASAYGKNSAQGIINNSDILYVEPDKKRTNNWLQIQRLQLPSSVTNYGPIHNVTLVDKNVNGNIEIASNDTKTAIERAFEKAKQSTNDKTKFSRSFDSAGRNLTEDQAEYFKDSKIRDAEGNLFALYHGTPNNFTVFDVSRSGENYDGWSQLGKGIYLAPDEKTAQHYADNAGRGRLTKVMPLYANLVNPFNVMNHVDFSIDDMTGKYGLNDYNVQFISKYGYRFIDFLSEHDEPIMDYLKSKGFDGIWDSYNGKNPSQVVAFEPNQVKNIDNTNPTENADIRFSRSFDAAGRILSEGQETYFKDSQVRDDNGNLMPVYHGTDADFNIFDTSVNGGKNGTAEGFGIYLTNDEEVSKHYGGRVIEGYANITRPATSWQKTIKQPELAKLIQKTCEMEADKMAANDGYDDRAQALRDTWISNYVYTPEYSTINGAYNAVAREILKANDNDMDVIQEVIIGQGIRDYEGAMQFYNEALTPTTGIDGFWTKWSDAEGNETADVMLAFSSNQVKNLDNLTPTTNPDIRFSRAMDSNLRTLSDEQAEFFKDSKVRDRFGNLLALRHGTASDFTVFDPSRSGNNYNGFSEFGPGIYLTPDVGMAKFYADKATKISNGESKIMDLYANITNPFDVIKPIEFSIDDIAEKYNLHDYDVAEMTRWGDKLLKFLIDKGEDTRAYLSGKGYDGIIVSWYENTPSQVIAFNPNQVKNIDNLTPTTNEDIRFSRSFASTEEMDRAYNEAVKSNPEEAQKMLDAYAEEKGYTPYALYHGTDNYGFTEFDLGRMDDGRSIFMTDEKEVARSYSNSEYVGTPKPLVTDDLRGLVDEYIAQNPRDKVTVISPDGLEKEYARIIDNAHKEIAKNKKSFENDVERYGWAEDDNDRLEAISAAYEKGLNAETREELDEARDDFMDVFGDFVPEYFDISDHLSQLSDMDVAMEYGEPVAYIKYDGYGYGEYMTADDLLQLLGSNDNASGNLKLYAKTDNPLIFDANLDGWDTMKFDPLGVAKKMGEIQTMAWKELGLAIDPKEVNNLYKTGEISDGIETAMQNDSIKQLVNEVGDASVEYQRYNIDPFNHTTRTREVSAYAKGNGYDSVIFKNLYDIGRYGGTRRHSTIYILFNPSQAKSADLVTYYGDGTSIPLSQRFDTTQTDIRFSRNFGDLNTYIAKAENEYIRDCVTNFNSSKTAKKILSKVNPAAVAQQVKSRYNSTVDTTLLQKAVDELKQYAADRVSTGNDVNYVDAKVIANAVAREVILKNKALTDTDGYKTYEKMVKFVGEMPIKIPGGVSRYIDNYQGWKTANIDNIRIETNGMPVKEAYSRFNRAFGDELFPANLKQYEMAERIAEVVGNYRNIYENPYNMDIDLATQFAANDIMNSVFATPDSFAFDNANLDSVYDTINNRRGKLVEAIGTAYEKGEDIDITTTEEFRKAQTIETETDDGVDYRHANLNPEEWKTTKTKGNKAKKVLSPTDIIAKMEHDFGHNITEGQIRKKDVLGTFNRNNKGIRIKFSNDLPTACHELGHALDLKYNIQSRLTESMKNELMTRHRKGVQALIASYPENKRLGEAIAEYNREFLQNRDNVLNRFPEFSNFYLNSMSEDDRANMFALADNINAYYVASAKTAQQSVRLRSEGQPDYRTFGEKLKDKCKHLYQMFVDSNAAINDFSKATGSNAYILATNAAYADARAGQIIVGALFDKDGTMVSEGLTAALNEINLNDDVEYKAFGEYLIVKHGPEFMETTGGDVFSHPTENTAEWMNKRAAELEEKYPAFKESAEKLYNFQNQFLYTWGVETGLISEEVYNEWTERWKYYVPFNRVIVRDSRNGFVVGDQSRRGFANQTSGIHKAKGSTRDIYHPVDNIMMNIIRMVKAGMSNQVMVEIADAAVKNNVDANIMEKIPAPMVGKNFYTEALKKKLATQFEDANAMGQIADESLDAIEDIIDGIDAVITQYSVGKAVGDKVTLLRDGKEEFWKINDPFLLESLTKMQPNRAGGLLEAYAVMSRFMTSNITGNNIIWSLSRNAPKDLGTLYTYSTTKSPIKIFGGIAKAYSNNIKNAVGVEVDPYYMEYLAMGGGKTSAYTADINTADRARKQMRIKATQQKRHIPQLSSLIKSPIEMIELVSDTVELGPRFATYRALRNQGVEPQKAFYEACDVTVNFRRSGWMSRQINMVTPFFNANIQGIDKFVRFFTAANVPTNEKAKVLAGRAAFFVAQSALMAAITIALNYRDKDKEKEYEQLSTFTKNNYWCIPADIANRFGLSLKNGEFLALPKARELGILSSFIERCWEDRMRTDDHAWDEFAQYTSDNLLPAYLAELADGAIDKDKSVFEAMEEWPTNLGVFGVLAYAHANKDFLGRNIVSESLLNYEKKDQFTGKTSIPAYYIGQAFNLSPQKIDFVGQQVFSNVWKPMQALFPKDDFYKDKTLGVRNAWIKDSQYSNDLVNWMYDQADASEKKKNSDKENAEKVYRYSMDNKMKTFYGNYYSLTKEMDETADSRLYRQKVLDMISDYQESVENGVPQSQRAVYEVFKKYNDTSLLPTVMGTTIKDGSGAEYELNYKQYFNYQGSYNNNYYSTIFFFSIFKRSPTSHNFINFGNIFIMSIRKKAFPIIFSTCPPIYLWNYSCNTYS